MFQKIIDFIKNNTFTALLIACVIFIILYWLFFVDKSKKGTWDSTYTYDPEKKFGFTDSRRDSKGEAECRYVLETIFGQKFPKRRPKFMFNSETGSSMELDMYNKELGVACEYNGRQHYEFVPHFHRGGRGEFESQQRRDQQKRDVCRKLGIFLIEVPYNIKTAQIRDFIVKKLKSRKFN